jgi:hypothetical protein
MGLNLNIYEILGLGFIILFKFFFVAVYEVIFKTFQ